MNAMTARRPALATILLLLLGLGFSSAWAEDEQMEEVVVTGSLIKGTPVDAALPVEVYSAADLEDVGAPTALEFVKSLTVSGPTYGEAYYFSGSSTTNLVGYNLRGLGSDKTLTLFNGRRSFGIVSNFPSSAIGRVEILKDGAAVTYGADATGGVVNYITKENFEGIEVHTSYKAVSDSAGDWSMSLLGGKQMGETNFLVALEWEHRSELDTLDRSFSNEPYWVNPAPWSTLTNLTGWYALGALPDASTFTSSTDTMNEEFGPTYGFATDYTQASCEAVGGIWVNTYTCKYNYAPYYNIVEENETYRAYLQAHTELTDRAHFYAEVMFARRLQPHAYGSPSQPVTHGPARESGAARQFYVPKTNPYFAEFATRTGLANSALYGLMQGVVPVTYRAFAHGGNDSYAESSGSHSTPNRNETKSWFISSGVDGSFPNDITYDLAATYNQYYYTGTSPDVLGHRLQNALSGFGGPDCTAADEDPNRFGIQNATLGTDAASRAAVGCYYWNPFASGWAGQPMLGLANPSYGGSAYEMPIELTRWVMDQREYQSQEWNVTLDAVFTGATPVELGGGPIAWAAGTQWRTREYRIMTHSPYYNGEWPCQYREQVPVLPTDPKYTGCTPDEPGPFTFFSTQKPTQADQHEFSYFAELDFPILDNVSAVAAARYEEFNPGSLDTTVYKLSLKWDVTDHLTLRGSYGTNYQAPPITLIPGDIDNAVRSYSIAGGDWRGAQIVTDTNLVPETATVWSVGFIWQSEGFTDGSSIRFITDFYTIETEDEFTNLANVDDIATGVFSIPNPGGRNFADCSHPFVGRVTINGGACVQGVTTAQDFSQISTVYGNGPGQTTEGWDTSLTYGMPAFSGDLELGLSATIVTKYEFTPTILDGVTLKPTEDRLGFLNYATIAFAQPEQRINFYANYGWGIHNVRFVTSFTSGVDDERLRTSPGGLLPGTTTAVPISSYGLKGDDWLAYDVHYHGDFSFGSVSFSIVNLTDEDPPGAMEELGYDPRMGSPLGRTFELGWRKEF